jgi:hypothetical protein
MEEARRVLARLDRIEALQRGGASTGAVLEQVRALLAEAESWIRAEPPGEAHAAQEAVERCRQTVDRAVLDSARP